MANKNLTQPANGLERCELCKELTTSQHKHNNFHWALFLWDRNKGPDRHVVVFYIGVTVISLAGIIGWARDLVPGW